MDHVSLAALTRVVAVSALLAGTVVSAQGPIPGTPIRSAPIQGERQTAKPLEDTPGAFMPLRGSSRGATIYGIVQNHLGQLLPLAGVIQVRSLIDGKIVAQAKVDDLARYTLRGFEPGVYAVELVDQAGSVIGTSAAFSAGAGEVIQLAPVIPVTPVSSFASMLGNATSSAVSSAANAGVLGLASGAPVSPPS